jgi:hypothetical protein
MRITLIVLTTIGSLWVSGCSSFQSKQNVTIEGRGARFYDENGQPIAGSGRYYKNVTEGFASGYSEGISEQLRREYWNKQASQSTNREGHVVLYDATIPSRVDADGVRRVERNVVVPVVE